MECDLVIVKNITYAPVIGETRFAACLSVCVSSILLLLLLLLLLRSLLCLITTPEVHKARKHTT